MKNNPEALITLLIYLHAFLGGLGLISGMISILVKKGGVIHKRSGKIFTWAMITSSLISLFVATRPNHENTFLFLIGLFTIYMVLAGNAALTFKNKRKLKASYQDKSISGIMLLLSITMVITGVWSMIQKIDNSILYIFFGAIGIFLTTRDFQTYNSINHKRNAWIKSHIGRMVGAFIASVTAFLVAGLHIGILLFWILPTIIGSFYIIYWTRKFNTGKTILSNRLRSS